LLHTLGLIMHASQRADTDAIERVNKAIDEGRAKAGQRYIEVVEFFPPSNDQGMLDFDAEVCARNFDAAYRKAEPEILEWMKGCDRTHMSKAEFLAAVNRACETVRQWAPVQNPRRERSNERVYCYEFV